MEDSLKPKEPVGNAQTPPSSPLRQIRTYQGDVAEALTRQNESLYSIQAKEHLKASFLDSQRTEARPNKHIFPLLLGTLLLIALTTFGGYYTYQEFSRKTTPPVVVAPPSRLLSAESTTEFDLANQSRDPVIQGIEDTLKGIKPSELRHVVIKDNGAEASTTLFFTTLKTSAPASLVRALDPTFMFGSLGESRFMIFKLTSFPNAFAGMLAWESGLVSDLGPLFPTPGVVKTIAPASVFKDVVYKNKDARVLYGEGVDENGATSTVPVLLYSFFNNRMLIITDRLETLQTLMDRLTQDSLVR